MTEEPDNVVLMLPREIRSTRTEHGRHLEHIEGRIEEMHLRVLSALGLAAHANDTVEKT